MDESNVFSTISLYLTLIGLLGTFFNLHLSSWLRDLIKLKSKFDINQAKSDTDMKKAYRECKFEIKGLFNHVSIVITIPLTIFIWISYRNVNILLPLIKDISLQNQLSQMLTTFVVIFGLLTLYFLGHGYILGCHIQNKYK